MLTRLSLLCFGLMAGFFYAYSVTVMPGLDDAATAAVKAMQGINRVVRNPVFFACFFGGAALPFAAAAHELLRGRRSAGLLMAGAGAFYLLGVIVFTAQFHVPMNNALALVAAPAAPEVWPAYSGDWTLGNHARTAVCVICLALSAEALRLR